MPAEAWVALLVGIAGIVGTVVGAAWRVSTQLTKAITRFEMIGATQATEIKELKDAVTKFADLVSLVAVQKEEIRALRETEAQNTRRTDETFTRIFSRLDNLQN